MYAAPTEEMVRLVAERVHRKALLILAAEVSEEQQTK